MVIIWLMMGNNNLVGGWFQPLWKMMDFVSWEYEIPNWMESHKSHVPNHHEVVAYLICKWNKLWLPKQSLPRPSNALPKYVRPHRPFWANLYDCNNFQSMIHGPPTIHQALHGLNCRWFTGILVSNPKSIAWNKPVLKWLKFNLCD
jgi:hypothetical protein